MSMTNHFMRWTLAIIVAIVVLFLIVPWLLSQANDGAVMLGVLVAVFALYGIWNFVERECKRIPDLSNLNDTVKVTEADKVKQPEEKEKPNASEPPTPKTTG